LYIKYEIQIVKNEQLARKSKGLKVGSLETPHPLESANQPQQKKIDVNINIKGQLGFTPSYYWSTIGFV